MTIGCNPFTEPPKLAIDQVKTSDDAEAFINWASEDYHAHPSHPSSCPAYEKHYGQRCICEDAADQQLKERGF